MKWIKLFEGFEQDTKIKWVNDIFFYHRITQDLHEMNLAKIETAQNVYYYSLHGKIKHLKFVLQKETSLLSYAPGRMKSYKISYHLLTGTNYLYSVYQLTPVYKKALSDFFEKYENIKISFRNDNYVYSDQWNRLVSSFRKTKAYKL